MHVQIQAHFYVNNNLLIDAIRLNTLCLYEVSQGSVLLSNSIPEDTINEYCLIENLILNFIDHSKTNLKIT